MTAATVRFCVSQLLLIWISSVSTDRVGTCFLSPFQLPASSAGAELRSTNAHGNAPQVPPNQLTGGPTDNRIVDPDSGQEKEPSSQVKETPDTSSNGFLFPGEKPSTTTEPPIETTKTRIIASRPPPAAKGGGSDVRITRPIEIPKRPLPPPPLPSKGGTNTRFVFPGEVPAPVRTTTRPLPPPPPIIQQRERSPVRRPASRIFGSSNRGFPSHGLFFGKENQLINWQELDAISQFEAALDEAKREGLYGLRTRSRSRTTTRAPVRAPVQHATYSSSQYSAVTGNQRDDLGFFESGVEDFKESFGFDPIHDGLFGSANAPNANGRWQHTAASSTEEDFGTHVPPPPPLSQILSSSRVTTSSFVSDQEFAASSAGKFYQWLDKSSFLRNMRIAPDTNFTVLLPHDDAVRALPPDFVKQLETNGTKLREILFYHIIPESLAVDAIASEEMIPTLLRKKDIRITKSSAPSDALMMSGAKVLGERKDLELDGGKIRFIQIDNLLMPPRGTLYDLIAAAPGLSVFKRLIEQTGLQSHLQRFANSAENGITIFAPSDSAFSELNSQAADLLTRDSSVARSLILNHMAKPVIFASAIPSGAASIVKNLGSGHELRIERPSQDLIQVNGVVVSFADILATNGVLHVTEKILL